MTDENSTVATSGNDGAGELDPLSPETSQAQQLTAAEARQPTRLESFFAVTKSLILRALVIYFISSFFRKPQTPTTPVVGTPEGPRHKAWNLFENGVIFDLYLYASEDYDNVNFTSPSSLLWYQPNLEYGDWESGQTADGVYTHHTKIKASDRLKNNGSIYIHAYVLKSGQSPDPNAGSLYAGKYMGHTRRLLNKFKKVRYTKTQNLLTGETEKSEEEIRKSEIMKDEILSHWHPNLTLNLVVDQTNWVKGAVTPPLDEYVYFVNDGEKYLPIIFVNDYWNMIRDYQPINETTDMLDLSLTFQPISLFKWQLYAAQAKKNKWSIMTAGMEENEEDQDSLKEILLDSNPILLGLTIFVSILHSIFELLAFKNDIQFWKNRKSLEGLSVRSVFFSVFQSLIVLLYVLDNETNFMIRVSCFIGLGIEVWKIQKVIDVSLTGEKIAGLIPKLTFKDKGSYVESSTRHYDNLAFKYLGWLCFPLLIGYSVYSLVYNEHKGWYSFILNMLYGYLLTFGFIMMTPQLFINYKLKSVAHLPWRMLTYKFLNTFIDDIFAFVIKMPTMYRLGCFRDDIVFFIFLYQRWQYKVDKKRVNEFGFSAEMDDDSTKQLVAAPPAEGTIAVAPADESSTAEPKSATNKKDD